MSWTRFAATRQLLAAIGPDDALVSSLGPTTIDLHLAGDRDANFYLFGAMGLATSVALGLARAAEPRRVIALEGDGALLMNLGSLTTISVLQPRNLGVIVWDNGRYESTGGQLTHAGRGIELEPLARAAGLEQTETVEHPDAFGAALERSLAATGPWMIVAKVAGGTDKTKAPPWTPVFFKERFARAMTARS